MKAGDVWELAAQIVAGMEAKYGNAPYSDRGRTIDTIIADAAEWEYYIAASIYAFDSVGILPGFKEA